MINDLKIKVCGMKYPENIREMAGLKPDYMGFIFYGGSPRNFSGEIPEIADSIKRTGVFVNADAQFIAEKIKKYGLQAVQLHGEESPELCSKIKDLGVEVIKAVSVGSDFNFEELDKYKDKIDLFLFDTKGKERGGTGKVFNWEMLREYHLHIPFFLSGGIGIEHAGKIRYFRESVLNEEQKKLFSGIDVNSRLEISPGHKDCQGFRDLKKELEKI